MADDEIDDDLAGPSAADALPDRRQKLAERASAARPWLDRALLNLRVWLPVLRTPDMKARQVKYRSSDARSGMSWKVGLPRQCYACGKTEGLTLRKFSQEVRAFEAPTTILGGTVSAAVLLFLLWLLTFWTPCLILAFLILILGSTYQFIKSWKERVKINLFSCAEHLEELTPPEVVSHDEDLYVYLPHESLTEAARAELIASRKKQQKLRPPLSPEPAAGDNEPAPTNLGALPPSRQTTVRTELPPLKLAGEEDD